MKYHEKIKYHEMVPSFAFLGTEKKFHKLQTVMNLYDLRETTGFSDDLLS